VRRQRILCSSFTLAMTLRRQLAVRAHLLHGVDILLVHLFLGIGVPGHAGAFEVEPLVGVGALVLVHQAEDVSCRVQCQSHSLQ
jgi:hypothetical protein